MKTEKLLLSAGIALTLAFTGCASQQHSSDISAASSAEEKKKDTTAPVITFTADSASVEAGTEYSPADNIKSVRDDVDGELKKADSLSKGKAGYVIDDSKTDLSAAGEYKVVVKAQDKAGNVSEKSFRLTVESKGSVEEASEKKKKTESTEKKGFWYFRHIEEQQCFQKDGNIVFTESSEFHCERTKERDRCLSAFSAGTGIQTRSTGTCAQLGMGRSRL